jgi:hypothetical protein
VTATGQGRDASSLEAVASGANALVQAGRLAEASRLLDLGLSLGP